MDYKKLYLFLFGRVSEALNELERLNFGRAGELLRAAQNDCEEQYADATD